MSGTRDSLLFLAANADWLMHRPEAEEAYDEILAALGQLRRTIDTAAPRDYAGPCDVCGRDMYARPGDVEVTCKPCALIYPMEHRREWLLDQADDELARATDIAKALTGFGHDITRHRIGTWRDRGQLEPKGIDGIGRPLYRVGDVRKLLKEGLPKKSDAAIA